MNEINQKILEMISQNKNMKEISLILEISEKELYVRIKQILNYGYQLEPSYSYNSDIYYKIIKGFNNEKITSTSIKVSNSIKEFRCIAISDIHIGNKDSNMDLLKTVYEYAAKNSINLIFNCGDLIEGVHTSDAKTLNRIESQIEYLIKKYPYDKNINNFMILGNHDYHSLHYDGLDISKSIQNARYDLIPIGCGQGNVKIRDDILTLQHNLSIIQNQDLPQNSKLVLVGHGHMMKTKLYDKLFICVPTLSNISPDKTKEVVPGFLDMTIHFEKDRFDFVEVKHLLITPKIIGINESRCRMKPLFKNKQ